MGSDDMIATQWFPTTAKADENQEKQQDKGGPSNSAGWSPARMARHSCSAGMEA